jgi:hypothetical protein
VIDEVGVNCVLEVTAAEIGKEDVDCFCAVSFLDRCVVLRSRISTWETGQQTEHSREKLKERSGGTQKK